MVSSKTGTLIQASLAPKTEILTLGYDTVTLGRRRERSGDLRSLDGSVTSHRRAGLTQEEGGDDDLET